MVNDIDNILNELNQGQTKNRVDNTDVSACLLVLNGIDGDTAFYLNKCKGLISPSVLSKRADSYFKSDKIEELMNALRPLVNYKKTVGDGELPDNWSDLDVEKLTPEELEKMGTFLLRNASMRGSNVDPKEINDLIKMLDAVGALPKKQSDDRKIKQVVVNVPFNSVCSCGKEIFDPFIVGYFFDKVISGEYSIETPPDEILNDIEKFKRAVNNGKNR